MVLDYLGVNFNYASLIKMLKIGAGGTAAANIKNLERLGVRVLFDYGDLQRLSDYIEGGEPCIAFVMTGSLPYWDFATPHAVVVVGIDEASVYVNDPAEGTAPQVVTRTQFESAWLDFDYYYALIRRR